jgi:hypothetical protein
MEHCKKKLLVLSKNSFVHHVLYSAVSLSTSLITELITEITRRRAALVEKDQIDLDTTNRLMNQSWVIWWEQLQHGTKVSNGRREFRVDIAKFNELYESRKNFISYRLEVGW